MKKYSIVCDKCQKEFDEKDGARLTISWLQQRREPNVEADLCQSCRASIIGSFATSLYHQEYKPIFEIPTEKGIAVIEKVAEIKAEPVPATTYVNTDELLPDEKRDVKEILVRMDAAAKKSRGTKSPSEMLAEKFEGKKGSAPLIEEDCPHIKIVDIDKSKGYTQCIQCGRNLLNGREIS